MPGQPRCNNDQGKRPLDPQSCFLKLLGESGRSDIAGSRWVGVPLVAAVDTFDGVNDGGLE